MAVVTINDTYLSDIAEAIRGKNGTASTYTPSEMAAAINDLDTFDDSGVLLAITPSNEPTTLDLSTYGISAEQVKYVAIHGKNTSSSGITGAAFYDSNALTIESNGYYGCQGYKRTNSLCYQLGAAKNRNTAYLTTTNTTYNYALPVIKLDGNLLSFGFEKHGEAEVVAPNGDGNIDSYGITSVLIKYVPAEEAN